MIHRWHGHIIGHRMAEVITYVHQHESVHPVRPREVATAVGHGDTRSGYRIVHRAVDAGLVWIQPDHTHRGWGWVHVGGGTK